MVMPPRSCVPVVFVLLAAQRECFSVKHYAGTVKYTVEGWVDRNKDSIPPAFAASLGSSSHKVGREETSFWDAGSQTGGEGYRTAREDTC